MYNNEWKEFADFFIQSLIEKNCECDYLSTSITLAKYFVENPTDTELEEINNGKFSMLSVIADTCNINVFIFALSKSLDKSYMDAYTLFAAWKRGKEFIIAIGQEKFNRTISSQFVRNKLEYFYESNDHYSDALNFEKCCGTFLDNIDANLDTNQDAYDEVTKRI